MTEAPAPTSPSLFDRWTWRLVRRGRLRRAEAALRDGRADAARRELTHLGARDDGTAQVLVAAADVVAAPTPPNAGRCVATLAGVGAVATVPDSILDVVSDVLRPVLQVTSGLPGAEIDRRAELVEHLVTVAGPRPWARHVLAVRALRAGDTGSSERLLAEGVDAPADAWPAAVLAGAGAAIAGDPDTLVRAISGQVGPEQAADHLLLSDLGAVLDALRDDTLVDPAVVLRLLAEPAGSLPRVVPRLRAVSLLLAATVEHVKAASDPRALDDGWALWLADRLRYATGEATEVLDAAGARTTTRDGVTAGEGQALTWQRLGSQQDLMALLTADEAEATRERLLAQEESLAPGQATTPWGHLVVSRAWLAASLASSGPGPGGPAPDDAGTDDSGTDDGGRDVACPWWPEDGVLQTLARRELVVERAYLAGRHALRQGDPDGAAAHFERARAAAAGGGLASGLVRLRFDPLLAYWEGVALARGGAFAAAVPLLGGCCGGVRDREARAQLALILVAGGDATQARELLATVRAPLPASALYLEALLASRLASRDGGDRCGPALAGLAERGAAAAGYSGAGRRLHGRIDEAAGRVDLAVERYRQALEIDPADGVAAGRLARCGLTAPGALDRATADLALAALPDAGPAAHVRAAIECMARTTAERARQLLTTPRSTAERLLALRNAVVAGEEDAAVGTARRWAQEDPEPRLARVVLVARASAAVSRFCGTGGGGLAAAGLRDVRLELEAADTDPVTAFWLDVARRLQGHATPDDAAPDDTAPDDTAPDDTARSAPMRLLSGALATFSADPAERRAGALACRAVLREPTPVPDPARALARCLAGDASGDDRELLAGWRALGPDLRRLPWSTADAYLALTEARLRAGDHDAVLDGDIPEPLADLSHPGVRRATAIAYARRAARHAARDARSALRDIDQARELLRTVE